MGMLSDDERASVSPARLIDNPTPVPTRVVSSDEFIPVPQTERQRKVEARMNALADDYGRKNGLSRRFAALKTDYEGRGREPSNLRYGFVVPT